MVESGENSDTASRFFFLWDRIPKCIPGQFADFSGFIPFGFRCIVGICDAYSVFGSDDEGEMQQPRPDKTSDMQEVFETITSLP